ncbi:cytochrome d ubiquinol oxidase subunit II [Aliikangiella sp. G2MR2-5]|uniref:cytochrome d ubiquinol oxidase subunit II n=1 Tax=Aliikangiella sp. G2MR2-5 TaxID=2788943 RepID=UPI0018AC1957|nr:cytochrome d ubiquinol oxidase subunit II [Aliikangiella sp. G2MR2-5]
MNLEQSLPYIFLALMAVSILMYTVLDGFDLGVGLLLPKDNLEYRNRMIASIGPFWDANETWLVLAVGILLIAFPSAHSMVLKSLYLPALFLLIGLILRGVAFDFRAKAVTRFRELWDKLFWLGSLLATCAQGFMLGMYVMGFEYNLTSILFSILSAFCLTNAYRYIGGTWLVMKTEGELQKFAARKARVAGWITAAGVLAICIANPLISEEVAQKWFSMPEAILLLPIPLMCFVILLVNDLYLKHAPLENDKACWLPFCLTAILFCLCLIGLVYSYYPYVIPNRLLATDAVSSTASLEFILYGVVIVLPIIIAYTLLSYWLFRGKSENLSYY